MKFKVVLVEDSRLAQNELHTLLEPYQSFEVIGQTKNIEDAHSVIESKQPDLLLLDINLPDGTGFDLLSKLTWVPAVIFTTAYDEFAIKAFEHNALDYLLKPISENRFAQALEKFIGHADGPKQPKPIDHKIFVKEQERCWLIDVQDIKYFKSMGNYTQINFSQHSPMLYKSLTQIQTRLPENQFFRANRSHIVNIDYVNKIEPYGNTGLLLTMDDGEEIDVSRRHASHLKKALSL